MSVCDTEQPRVRQSSPLTRLSIKARAGSFAATFSVEARDIGTSAPVNCILNKHANLWKSYMCHCLFITPLGNPSRAFTALHWDGGSLQHFTKETTRLKMAQYSISCQKYTGGQIWPRGLKYPPCFERGKNCLSAAVRFQLIDM